MFTLIDNTYIRITLPSINSGILSNGVKRCFNLAIKIFLNINRFPNKRRFYYPKEEERFRIKHEIDRSKMPWLY